MKRLFIGLAIVVILVILTLGVGYRNALADPVVHVTDALPNWPAGTSPIRVALISDIPLGNAVTDEARLERL